MTPERFTDLAEAYGADLRRWPADERPGAEALIARDPAMADRLSEAAYLDRALEAYVSPAPSTMLRSRILAQAPQRGPIRRRVAAWWVAGGAMIAAAGAVAGAALILVAPQVRDPGTGWVYDQTTAFGDLNSAQDS